MGMTLRRPVVSPCSVHGRTSGEVLDDHCKRGVMCNPDAGEWIVRRAKCRCRRSVHDYSEYRRFDDPTLPAPLLKLPDMGTPGGGT